MPYFPSSCALRSEHGSTSANGAVFGPLLADGFSVDVYGSSGCNGVGVPPCVDEQAGMTRRAVVANDARKADFVRTLAPGELRLDHHGDLIGDVAALVGAFARHHVHVHSGRLRDADSDQTDARTGNTRYLPAVGLGGVNAHPAVLDIVDSLLVADVYRDDAAGVGRAFAVLLELTTTC